MIAARNVTKHYGTRRALDGLEFTAGDGSITGLLGPNGAGKTTAFRIASGLLKPDAGEIVITAAPDDTTAQGDPNRADHRYWSSAESPTRPTRLTCQAEALTNSSELRLSRRRLGVLPHVHGLYARLTVREHIRYFGALRGMDGRLLESRLADLVAELGLGEVADSLTQTLSQGQRVKVAVACALVHNPMNLILDEPTSGLDVMSTRALHGLLRTLRDRGACVLFSSHVMHEVASLCDHVVMLAHGRVITAGSPVDLLERHRVGSLEDLFVAVAS